MTPRKLLARCVFIGVSLYTTPVKSGSAGLVPDLSGRWYGYAVKMVYLKHGVFIL